MDCEICGKPLHKEIRIDSDGVILLVCEDCSKYGKKLETPEERIQKAKGSQPSEKQFFNAFKSDANKKEKELMLDSDYGNIIRKARERKSLTMKELAEKLYEKESFLQKVESGKAVPSDSLISKLEKFLGISLKTEVEEIELKQTGSGKMTLADLLDKEKEKQ